MRWASSTELVSGLPSLSLTLMTDRPCNGWTQSSATLSQQTSYMRLAILCADSTNNIAVPSGPSYCAAPISGKPVGWKRVPCSGCSFASNSRRGASFNVERSRLMAVSFQSSTMLCRRISSRIMDLLQHAPCKLAIRAVTQRNEQRSSYALRRDAIECRQSVLRKNRLHASNAESPPCRKHHAIGLMFGGKLRKNPRGHRKVHIWLKHSQTAQNRVGRKA